MKLLKKLSSMLLVLLVVLMPTVNAASTFTISNSNTHYLYGSSILGHGSTLNFTYKVNNDGKIVYCTEIHDSMTSGTETYTYSYHASNAIQYVLENGYPNKSLTKNNDKDYYITGLAIWYLLAPNDSVFTYFDLSAGTYKGYSSDVVQQIAKLVNGSKNYTPVTPSMTLTNPNSNMSLSSDKAYYVSNAITVNKVGNVGDYTVTLNGAPANSQVVKNGNTFTVKVPASSVTASTSFTVDVKANGTKNGADVYAPTDSSHQSLVGLFGTTIALSQSTKLNLTKVTEQKGTVRISKLDAGSGKELAGATLVVKDSKGNIIDEWVSDGSVHVINNLEIGTYTLTETFAPDGYILNEEKVTFTITKDKLETSAVMYNKLKPTGTVKISKLDIANDKELKGAHLVVKDSKGKIIDEWISDGSVHIITNLALGTYTLTETLAPEGYVLNEETVKFTITEDKLETTAVMYNSLKEVTKVKISKQDITNGQELPGAHLVIKDSKGNVVEEWISGTEPHMIEGLNAGEKYTLTETIAPDGYVLNEETIEFTVNEDGSVSTVIMYNAPSEVITEVPATSSFKNSAYSLMGLLGIGFGSLVIYKKTKENE